MMSVNSIQKLEPGVYKVLKSFSYLSFNIDEGEILNVYIKGDPRVIGGLWYGFDRDKEHVEYFNMGLFKQKFTQYPRTYNSKYIPIDCVI